MSNEMEKLVMDEFNENFYNEFSKDLTQNLKTMKADIETLIEVLDNPVETIKNVDGVVNLLRNLMDDVNVNIDFYRLKITERLNDLCNMENSFKYATKRIK